MQTYVMLTRLSPEALKDPANIEDLNRKVTEHIRSQCPEARWLGSYSIMGPYDYLDLFEAPNEEIAAKVSLIVRTFGHATTETWLATPWEKFAAISKKLAQTAKVGAR